MEGRPRRCAARVGARCARAVRGRVAAPGAGLIEGFPCRCGALAQRCSTSACAPPAWVATSGERECPAGGRRSRWPDHYASRSGRCASARGAPSCPAGAWSGEPAALARPARHDAREGRRAAAAAPRPHQWPSPCTGRERDSAEKGERRGRGVGSASTGDGEGRRWGRWRGSAAEVARCRDFFS